jgi:hypothetical protein
MRPIARPISVSFVLTWALSSKGQATAPTQPLVIASTQPATTLPKTEGTPLSVARDVSGRTSVWAALLPASVAQRIFGKAISDHYAAVQMTIFNHNPGAAPISPKGPAQLQSVAVSSNFKLRCHRIFAFIVEILQPTHLIR